jgi:MerR family copper efflux transcriptional regulator
MDHMSIGQLAREADIHLETIRFYEREGLMPAPSRLPSGHRTFDQAALRRLRFIKRAQELGFSLSEVRELFTLQAQPDRDCADVCEKARKKLGDVEQKIKDLVRIRRALRHLTECCCGGRPIRECGILEALEEVRK